MSKPSDRNIIQVSLSAFAYKRIKLLAELMGSKPATQAARPLEDWVLSDEFERQLLIAQKQHQLDQEE